jgi:hypothetical protein
MNDVGCLVRPTGIIVEHRDKGKPGSLVTPSPHR